MTKCFVTLVLALTCAESAFGHRLDEYLQATIFSFTPGALHATLRMVPGVAAAPRVIAAIDTNGDNILSAGEQQQYAGQVLRDLRLYEDGQLLTLQLDSATFATIEQMRAGTGEIQVAFSSPLSYAHGEHLLLFENQHFKSLSVYLVNSLTPDDARIQLGQQTRSENQARYSVPFTRDSVLVAGAPSTSGFAAAFHLGAQHIAEGTDHLLFLLTLLLPAPLLAFESQWARQATVRQTITHILGIVTAFTLGHSLTLALAVFGLVRLPSRPVELLIAVSILVSAMHALRPLFAGREALIAGAFGLVHGLAFASALNELGVTGWYRTLSLLGFNLGIETMQLAVVAVALPPLLLLSRTRFSSAFRCAGAVFGIVASLAWIVERLTGRPTTIGAWVQVLAQHGTAIACGIWLVSFGAWLSLRTPTAAMLNAAE